MVGPPPTATTPSASIEWTDPTASRSSRTSARSRSAIPPPIYVLIIPIGVQYAFETFRGGFLVTDGHHNRVFGSPSTATSPS